jgi:hypothetical protein
MVSRLARAAIEKLKVRRVPIWVAFLQGPQFFQWFHKMRAFMLEVEKEQVGMEARIAAQLAVNPTGGA